MAAAWVSASGFTRAHSRVVLDSDHSTLLAQNPSNTTRPCLPELGVSLRRRSAHGRNGGNNDMVGAPECELSKGYAERASREERTC